MKNAIVRDIPLLSAEAFSRVVGAYTTLLECGVIGGFEISTIPGGPAELRWGGVVVATREMADE